MKKITFLLILVGIASLLISRQTNSEPGNLLLLGTGMVGLAGTRLRKRKSA